MAIAWTCKRSDFVEIRLVNDAGSMHPMQHPIHVHGQRFMIAAVNARLNDSLVGRYTVLAPSGETVDIVMEASHPGRRMAHCHIAEHQRAGMMLAHEVKK